MPACLPRLGTETRDPPPPHFAHRMDPWKPESKVLISDSIVPDFSWRFLPFVSPPCSGTIPALPAHRAPLFPFFMWLQLAGPAPRRCPSVGDRDRGHCPRGVCHEGEGPRGFDIPASSRSRRIQPPDRSPVLLARFGKGTPGWFLGSLEGGCCSCSERMVQEWSMGWGRPQNPHLGALWVPLLPPTTAGSCLRCPNPSSCSSSP